MNIDLLQYRIATGIICAISVWICYISFTQSPAEAYVFPRIISIVLVLTAGLTFVKAMFTQTKTVDGLSVEMVKNLLPGIIIGFLYFFWVAKFLGFYTATFLMFFALLSVYDPKPGKKAMTWVMRAAISTAYIALIYTVFALVLNVFTPRGLLH